MRGKDIVLSTYLPWDYCRDVHLRGRKSKNWYWGTVALGAHNWVYGAEQNWYWEGYLLPMWHVPELMGGLVATAVNQLDAEHPAKCLSPSKPGLFAVACAVRVWPPVLVGVVWVWPLVVLQALPPLMELEGPELGQTSAYMNSVADASLR